MTIVPFLVTMIIFRHRCFLQITRKTKKAQDIRTGVCYTVFARMREITPPLANNGGRRIISNEMA